MPGEMLSITYDFQTSSPTMTVDQPGATRWRSWESRPRRGP